MSDKARHFASKNGLVNGTVHGSATVENVGTLLDNTFRISDMVVIK